jgi:hypothetical protein
MSVATGTIILAMKGARFVVLAADQMWSGFERGVPASGFHCKIVLHPSLPLALATGGLAFLPHDGPPTTHYLEELATTITGPNDLKPPILADRLQRRLLPLVREARRLPYHPELEHVRQVNVYIACVRGGEVHLGCLSLEETADWDDEDMQYGFGPECLRSFYRSGEGRQRMAPFQGDRGNPADIASDWHKRVQGQIADEAALHGGQNRHVGPPVDVAIVDEHGARFFPPPVSAPQQ